MRVLLTALCCLSFWAASAQAHSAVPLTKLLAHFEASSDVEFAYDAVIVEHIHIPENYLNFPLQDVIFALNHSLPLTISQVSEEFYTLTVTEATYTVELISQEDGEAVDPDLVAVVVNGMPIKAEQLGTELQFTLTPNANDSIAIYAPGYEIALVPLADLLSGVYLKVPVRPLRIELAGVTIQDYLTKGIDVNPANQSIAIDVDDLPLLPGETDGDLFASLVALPGITTPDNRPGNLFIRGSSTDQSLITVDDIPIYHRGHYFGTISPYNPKMVDRVEVYRNGFHPRKGGRVGGAVAIQTNEHNSNELKGGIGTNTLYASAFLETPVGDRLALKIGARRSYPRSFNSPKLNAISHMIFAASALRDTSGKIKDDLEVLFEDYNVALSFKPNKRNLFTLSGLYTFSGIEYFATRDQVQEINETQNAGINFNWKHRFSQKLSSESSATFSDYQFGFRNGPAIGQNQPPTAGPGIYALNDIRDVSAFYELEWTFNQINRLQVGTMYAWQTVAHNYKDFSPRRSEPNLKSTELEGHTLAPFINLEWAPSEKWYVQLGSRLNYFSPLRRLDFAPRAFINYYFTDALTLKASAGKYYQYLSQVKGLEYASGGFDNELWRLANGEESRVIEGRQLMLGAIWSKHRWTVDVEAYDKTAHNVTHYSAVRVAPHGVYLTGNYSSRGVDLLVKRAISDDWNLWAGYSLSQTQITLDTSALVHDQKYSQPHVLYLGGAWTHNRWKASVGWRFASGQKGRNIYILRGSANYERDQQRGTPTSPTGPNPFDQVPDRYQPVHFLDCSASYTLPKTAQRNWALSFGVSITNVYNQQNLTDEVLRGGSTANPILYQRQAMDFAPNLMVMVEW